MPPLRTFTAILTTLLAACASRAGAPADRPPNFVVIFTDDQGYADLGCFGAEGFRTPNVDRMAAEGVRFTDFYVAAPVCTPSRAALLTGCYPRRIGLHERVLFPDSTTGLAADEVTVAEVLKTRGYATGCFGKWHLGHRPPFLPTRHGFDEYFGLPYSNDMTTTRITREGYPRLPLIRGENVVEYEPDQTQLTRRYTEAAVRFIREHADEPFFVYLPHSMPHIPLFASEAFAGRTERGLYGDVIEELDWSVGQILRALAETGVDERTLVIFTSDNGPWHSMGADGGSAGPLRGSKGTTWEGGMRVPAVMRWPGTLPAGAVSREVLTTLDLLPTLAAFAGAELAADRAIDGENRAAALLAPSSELDAKPRELFYFTQSEADGVVEAVRSGRWKLHVAKFKYDREEDEDWREGEVRLYDLESDVGEQRDVAAAHPEVALRLRRRIAEFQARIAAEARPVGRLP